MQFAKRQPLRSERLRQSAKGQPCTLQVPGVCQGLGSSVLCHLEDTTGTGTMAGKCDDYLAVVGCHACHAWIDTLPLAFSDPERIMHEGMVDKIKYTALKRTLQYWFDQKIVEVNEDGT